MKSETPRTAAEKSRHNSNHWLACHDVVSALFASELERELINSRTIYLKMAADIAAQQAADDARAADSTTDLDSRLNYLAQQERALVIEKAILGLMYEM